MKYDKKIEEFLTPAATDAGEMMDISKPADLARAIACVKKMFTDPRIDALAAAGDEMRKDQTKHDKQHGIDVHDIGMVLVREYDDRFPGKLTDWQKRVEAPISFFLHDMGSAIDVAFHAVAGARIAYIYLTQLKFPAQVVHNICRNIAGHRSEYVLEREFDDPIHALTVVADKCVGDENRVRPLQANMLRVLSLLGLGRINFWDDAAHDRVNFAIRQASVVVDSYDTHGDKDAGAFVLQLDLRTRVAPPAEVTQLYGKRFHACGRAAGFLGYAFRIEFNGVRYMYHKASQAWRPLHAISVPLP